MPRYESLPYRPCVGIMVINREGRVFIGKRRGGPEHVDATHSWQMPQGGVDKGEDTYKAALRELAEETGIRSVEKLGEVPEWLSYDIPRAIVGEAWKGKFRGQTQKWYALRFTGKDSRDQHRQPARRAQAGIHRLALGSDRQAAGADHPVQAAGLRAGGRRVRTVCERVDRRSEPQIARSHCRRELMRGARVEARHLHRAGRRSGHARQSRSAAAPCRPVARRQGRGRQPEGRGA